MVSIVAPPMVRIFIHRLRNEEIAGMSPFLFRSERQNVDARVEANICDGSRIGSGSNRLAP